VSAPDAPPASLRLLAEQALSRAAGAPLVPGNALTLLRDSTENYPAWLDAIEGARRSIAVESYILSEDPCEALPKTRRLQCIP
jgi:cardiolipin synthase A/B